MASFTVRAVELPDGSYRIAIQPGAPAVDVERIYTADEVRGLAEEIHADLRWVSAPETTRQMSDPWGGPLSAGDED